MTELDETRLALGADRERGLILGLLGPNAPAPESTDAAGHAIDWRRLVSEAGPQLLPYVGRRLAEAGWLELVPADLAAEIRLHNQRSALRHVRQRAALRSALATLSSAGIPVVALKGAALCHLVYPDPTLRPMLDIDLWGEPDRAIEACRTLDAAGWHRPTGGPDESLAAEAHSRRRRHPDLDVTVEIHGLPESFRELPSARLAGAWQGARPMTFGDLTMHVLDPADLLLHQCLNMKKDAFRVGLRPLLDVRLMVEKWRTDWRWTDLASDWMASGVSGTMYLALELARHLLGAPVPRALFDTLRRPPELDEMRDLAARSVLEAVSARLPKYAAALLERRSTAERLRHIAGRLTVFYLPRAPGAWRSPLRALGDMATRLGHDLFVKAPEDWRFLRQLVMDRSTIRRGVDLTRDRTRLATLLAAADRPANPLRS